MGNADSLPFAALRLQVAGPERRGIAETTGGPEINRFAIDGTPRKVCQSVQPGHRRRPGEAMRLGEFPILRELGRAGMGMVHHSLPPYPNSRISHARANVQSRQTELLETPSVAAVCSRLKPA